VKMIEITLTPAAAVQLTNVLIALLMARAEMQPGEAPPSWSGIVADVRDQVCRQLPEDPTGVPGELF